MCTLLSIPAAGDGCQDIKAYTISRSQGYSVSHMSLRVCWTKLTVLACLKVRKLAPRIRELDSLHVLIGCGVRLRTTLFHFQASPQLSLPQLNDERQPLLTYMCVSPRKFFIFRRPSVWDNADRNKHITARSFTVSCFAGTTQSREPVEMLPHGRVPSTSET